MSTILPKGESRLNVKLKIIKRVPPGLKSTILVFKSITFKIFLGLKMIKTASKDEADRRKALLDVEFLMSSYL